jgi:dienelactone hydrolase
LRLPDPLVANDGTTIATAAQWQSKRRAEILDLFREHVYGRDPIQRPGTLAFSVKETEPNAMQGKATRKLVTISFRGPGGGGAINLILFVPNGRTKPAPAFLLITGIARAIDGTRENKSAFWPAEEIVARGYAAAAFWTGDVAPDRKADRWTKGVHGIFDHRPRADDAWGTIAAWAWGASRVMDYLETDATIDPKRVAVVGQSRGGKTALWAGAQDERFALVVSNDSGCTGAKLTRVPGGETVLQINTSFPHWFCENYKRYNEHPEELPVDQHELIALMAPRPVYIASASEDSHANPRAEFLAARAASPVYALFRLPGLAATDFPPPDTALHDGMIGYHLRRGTHGLLEYDWQRFMEFADRRMK